MQDKRLEDWNEEQEAFFTMSTNGWSCDALDLKWLEQVFERCTKSKKRKLLIVGCHFSHVNMKFIDKCDILRILLLILPPHTTHRLQPLDVSLFAPLARDYTNGLNDMMFNSLGMTNMSKRAFWSVFWPAWQQTFTKENTASGFEKTGVFLLNSSIILDKITKPKPSIKNIQSSDILKTPMTGRAVRRIQKAYKEKPNDLLLWKIFIANERLAADHSIDQHIIKGLCEALKNKKKRRKRGKRLNLLGEEDNGPQFFSSARVQAARAWQASKNDEKTRKQEAVAAYEQLPDV